MPTKIEWVKNADGLAGETWNPLRARLIDGNANVSKSGHYGTGCTKISPGCQNCYASVMNRRFYGNEYSYQSRPTGFFLDEHILNLPRRRKKPTTWFVGSMTDIFHEVVPTNMQIEILQVMQDCPQHTFQLLTKRPAYMRRALNLFYRTGPTLSNVWAGVSVENQEMADLRIPLLLQVPAAIRWLSCEPLLGGIKFGPELLEFGLVDWIVCGGESGPHARPMEPDWARSLRDQCVMAEVPFFFKQIGGVNKKAAGRLLDGREWNEMPEVKR